MESITKPEVRDVPIFNLLSALEGHIINNEEDTFDTISGEVVIALPTPGECLKGVGSGSIVICGQQKDVVDKALEIGASCVIICQGSLSEKYLGLSSKTCIIATPCDAYRAARMIYQAIPVQRIAQHTGVVLFHLNDFIDDVRETVLQSRYRSYPVLDENEKVVGTLSRYHLLRPRRKRVVLVDHNEKSQSIPGLEQADIIAIIDHHRLADIQTGAPVFMRNEPVGSTTTIVATMFQERGLQPSEKMAGLMAAAILSDTVMFKSPTCTPRDRRMADRLARIAGIDLETLGREMFSAGSGADKPVEQLLNTDFKEFHIAGHNLGICQITCLDTDRMLERLPEILPEMQKIKDNKGYDMFLMMLTDVLRCGTELVFLGGDDAVRQAFNLNEDTSSHHVWLPKVVSRKKADCSGAGVAMGLMRRLAAAALAVVLLLSTALGERVTFRLSADIDPVQYPAQERKLAQGLKSLFRLLTVEGDVVASDGSFDARIDLGLTNAPEKTATRIRFFGLDSHWGIQSTTLGGETLMVNQLAWLEFAIKAYNHLDLPLQRVFLWLSPLCAHQRMGGCPTVDCRFGGTGKRWSAGKHGADNLRRRNRPPVRRGQGAVLLY